MFGGGGDTGFRGDAAFRGDKGFRRYEFRWWWCRGLICRWCRGLTRRWGNGAEPNEAKSKDGVEPRCQLCGMHALDLVGWSRLQLPRSFKSVPGIDRIASVLSQPNILGKSGGKVLPVYEVPYSYVFGLVLSDGRQTRETCRPWSLLKTH